MKAKCKLMMLGFQECAMAQKMKADPNAVKSTPNHMLNVCCLPGGKDVAHKFVSIPGARAKIFQSVQRCCKPVLCVITQSDPPSAMRMQIKDANLRADLALL
jgi:hypothetical protein